MKQGKIGFKSFVLQVAYAAYVVPRVDAPTQQTYDAKQTEQVSPPSFGKPWFYFDSERVDIVYPNAVGIGTLELQGVVTGGKVGKGEPVVMSELRPFVSRVQTGVQPVHPGAAAAWARQMPRRTPTPRCRSGRSRRADA